MTSCDAYKNLSNVEASSLKKLAARLSVVADRLRGVPLGQELAEIHCRLCEVADTFAGGAAADLAHTLSRLREEREELRHAFSKHVVDAADREQALMTQCERARQETPEVVQAELAVALQEEADASRAARAHLLAENAALQAELAAERQTLRAVRAELAAVRALHGSTGQNDRQLAHGAAVAQSEHCPAPALPSLDGADMAALDGASHAVDIVGLRSGCGARRAKSGPNRRVRRVAVPARSVGRDSVSPSPSPSLATCETEKDFEPVRPRRSLGFARRDFAEPAAEAPPPMTRARSA